MKNSIGSRFLEWRKALGKTQPEMSELTGIPLQNWKRYEGSKVIPGGDFIGKAVSAGVNANWLLTGAGPMLLANLKAGDLDMSHLRLAIETVDEGLTATRTAMTSAKKADLVAAVYDLTEKSGANKERVLKLIKLTA